MSAEGVIDYIPVPIAPADVRWSRGQSARALAAVGIPHPDFVFIDQPLFPARHFADATVIFRPTDIFPTERLRKAARLCANEADGVVATSPEVLRSVVGAARTPSHVLENGVEYSRFASEADAVAKEYDFVYVGALDFRFDFPLIVAAALALPQSTFAIFGPPPATSQQLPTNARLMGPVAYEDAPRAIARGRVGLMPFVENASNAGRSPMKLYEYLAAGVPVVAPAAIAARATGVESILPYDPSDARSFVRSLVQARAQTPPVHAHDADIARSKDWSAIAAQLLDFATSVARRGA